MQVDLNSNEKDKEKYENNNAKLSNSCNPRSTNLSSSILSLSKLSDSSSSESSDSDSNESYSILNNNKKSIHMMIERYHLHLIIEKNILVQPLTEEFLLLQ